MINKKLHSLVIRNIVILNLLFAFNFLNAQHITIPISSKAFTLLLQTDENSLLRTVYFGESLANESEYSSAAVNFNFKDENIGIVNAAYSSSGTWNLSEPAIQLVHSDGNKSLELKYVSHDTKQLEDNIRLTSILLKDPIYPVEVSLFYKVYMNENVLEQWTEIEHNEERNIKLQKFSSANLYFTDKDFYLTTFHNEWAK